MKKRAAALFLVAITMWLCEGMALAQQVGDTFDQFFRYVEVKNKVIEPHLPGEAVDHFSGNMRIVQEDMAFPGQGGLDLRIIRVYSSKIWGRSDLLALEPFLAGKELTDVGLGWSMHMGRVRDPNAFGQPPAGTVPVFEAQDGSSHAFYQVTGTDYLSRDSWKFTRNWQACSGAASGAGACITTTSGLRYEFAESNKYFIDGTTLVWPLSSIVDVFGNQILVRYQSGSSLGGSNGRILNITDTYGRTVTFDYGTCGTSASVPCLETIEARGPGGVFLRRMNYTHEVRDAGSVMGIGQKNVAFLTRAVLDTGNPTENSAYIYDYNFNPDVTKNAFALKSITYPYGGKTEYTYDTVRFFTGCDTIPMPAVRTRTTSGRLLPSGGTWTYTYESPSAVNDPTITDPDSTQASDFQTTTILRPDGKTDKYKFFGFAYLKRLNINGQTWKVGLQSQITRGSDAEAETFNWQKGAVIIQGIPNQQLYRAPFYGTTCPSWAFDNTIQAPVLKSHTLQRPGTGAPSQRATYKYEVVLPANPNSQADPDGDGFDDFGQPFKVIETGEVQRTIEYEYNYDDTLYQKVGRVTLENVCEGSVCYETRRTFGGLSNQMNSLTLKGVKTEFEYWQGNPHGNGNLRTVKNALGHELKLNYIDGFGLPTDIDFNGLFKITRQANPDGSLRSETRRGQTTSYTYDLAGRLRTITLPPGSNSNDPTTYCYRVIAGVEESYSITRGGPIGQCPTNPQTRQYRETMTLDGLGRVIETANSLGESQSRVFDTFGRVIFNSYPFGSGVPAIGDKFEYDALGRPTITSRRFLNTGSGSCTDAASCRQRTIYNDKAHCRTTTTDRAASDLTTTTSCFESYGNVNDERLISVRDANSRQWTYSYDVAGNLTDFKALQPGGNRRFTYHPKTFFLKTDESGPRGTIQLPLSAYNDIGQPKERTDARSIKTTFEYGDPLSRLTKTSYSIGGGQEDVTRTYDGEDLETVSSMAGGAYTYEYDELARLSDQSWTFQNNTYETKYRFDGAGCLERLFYPTGTIATITCDAKGRPRSIILTGTTNGTIVTNATYHPGGQQKLIEYGNGVNVSRTIENGRIKSISTSGALLPIPGFTYAYDGANNITAITDSTGMNTLSKITYDKLDRVLHVYRQSTTSPAFSYFYDELGNRKQLNGSGNATTKYVYDAKTNLLLQSTGPSAPPLGSLTWNAAGQLATNLDGTKYQYDGLGRRVLKSPPSGNAIVYHYDVAGRLIAETLATSGAPIREYFYLGNQLVAIAGCMSGNVLPCSELEWYHTDILGNVIARTNSNKAVTVGLVYQAWGELPSAGTGVPGTRLYNGRTFDEFSVGGGFYDYGARIYSPELGRFLSADPVWSQQSDPQSANFYAYTLNNPYKYTDPKGKFPVPAFPTNWFTPIRTLQALFSIRPSAKERPISEHAVDVFAFGAVSKTAPIHSPVSNLLVNEIEEITIAGYNSESGPYGAVILARGTKLGTEKTYGMVWGGKEWLSSGEVENVIGVEGAFGTRATNIFVGAYEVGPNATGHYEKGLYGGVGVGSHGAVGVGFALPTVQGVFDWWIKMSYGLPYSW